MAFEQVSKTVQWLDEERRKDKQEIIALQERLTVVTTENTGLNRKLQKLEADLATTNAAIQRLSKIDEILGGYRKEMTRQLEEAEQRRADASREDDRLRKLEREGINKSLAELRKGLDPIPGLERDLQARREEESRASRLIAEIQKKVGDFNKYVDERNRSVTLVEEGRRQDAKRITELQAELTELRKRLDDSRGKVEILEDVVRRADARMGEISLADNERRAVQAQWLDAQSILQSERERAWIELREKTESALEKLTDYAHRVEQYAEGNREIKRAADDYRQMAELIERRLNEVGEIQRLNEERLRQDWAAFMADDQKRWATHMLLRDEQWREHDRLNVRQIERSENMEEQLTLITDALRQIQVVDADRMQKILNVVRELVADSEQPTFVKAR